MFLKNPYKIPKHKIENALSNNLQLNWILIK